MGRGLSVANPDWSPDGQTIVVEISRSNSAGINLMTAAGSVINGVRAPGPTPHLPSFGQGLWGVGNLAGRYCRAASHRHSRRRSSRTGRDR